MGILITVNTFCIHLLTMTYMASKFNLVHGSLLWAGMVEVVSKRNVSLNITISHACTHISSFSVYANSMLAM